MIGNVLTDKYADLAATGFHVTDAPRRAVTPSCSWRGISPRFWRDSDLRFPSRAG